MQTPYAHVVNVSWQRQLPDGFVLEAAYLGRFGRNQLQQIDLAQPLDLVDPKSGRIISPPPRSFPKTVMPAQTNVAAYSSTSKTCFPTLPATA